MSINFTPTGSNIGDNTDDASTLPTEDTNLGGLPISKPMVQSNKRKSRSDVWNHFDATPDIDGSKVCQCKYCGHKYYKVTSRMGTGNMKRHLENCQRKNTSDIGKLVSGSASGSGSSRFDPDVFREMLCSAIVVHDLPFRFVEYERIKAVFEYLKWDVKMVTRNTIKADVLKTYENEKIRLKSVLARTPGRLCLTSDCWSSITTDGYISLTCHFVDEDWVLQNKLLNFSLMPSPHTGVALSNKLFSMLSNWGIEKKIFSLTLDNASANDVCVELLISQLNLNNALVREGEFFHIRCCAHIINLVVQDGLNDIEHSVVKIRESVKYVRGSQMRRQKFLECVSKLSLTSKRGLRQDVPTRWNSTFLMLDSALYYKKAFMNFQLSDPNYKSCPSSVEWDRIEKIRGFLSLFYDVSNLFSGSNYPTANLYFRPVVMCYNSLRQSVSSPDEYIKKMAEKMLPKFEKYWSDFSMILTIAVVFDPRYKLQFVDFFYTKLYGCNSRQYLQVKDKLFSLFGEYCKSHSDSLGSDKDEDSGMKDPSCTFTNEESMAMVEEFSALDFEFGLSQQKSQLEYYLQEKRIDVKSNIDILGYWKGMSSIFPQVASVARDILSIPITTVASESVFSVGGRVLDQYRSSLKPSTAEAIICTRDWLYGEKVFKSEVPTNELAEDFINDDDEFQAQHQSSTSTASSVTAL